MQSINSGKTKKLAGMNQFLDNDKDKKIKFDDVNMQIAKSLNEMRDMCYIKGGNLAVKKFDRKLIELFPKFVNELKTVIP
jgi:hypothetical protein